MTVGRKIIIALIIIGGLALLIVSSFFIDYQEIAQKAQSKESVEKTPTENLPAKIIEERAIKFSAVGDFDIGENFTQTLGNIKKLDTEFTIALGDLSYGKATEQDWCNQVNSTLGNKPFEIVPGNHDIEPKSQISKFARCLPNRIENIVGSYPDRYYFDQSKTLRTILISPDVAIDGNPNKFKAGSEEYVWLQKTLADAKEQKMRWVIVAMHKNCLTIGEKSCEIGQDLNDLLIKSPVDLVLQGHEHGYARSHQLTFSPTCLTIVPNKVNSSSCAVQSKESQYEKGNGSIFAIVGTGGAEARPINKNSTSMNLFNAYHGSNTGAVYGALLVEVTNNKLSAKLIENQTGTSKDSFSILYKEKSP